jgi:hypothetical protein
MEKAKLELKYEAYREAMYSRSKTALKNKYERVFDIIVREKIVEGCRECVNREIEKGWHKEGLGNNPW